MDVASILSASDSEIDLCILDSQNIYSREEAKSVLSKFFTTYEPSSCESVHAGSSRKNSSTYSLGKMTTKTGEDFRVFVYTNEHDLIIELRIDKW